MTANVPSTRARRRAVASVLSTREVMVRMSSTGAFGSVSRIAALSRGAMDAASVALRSTSVPDVTNGSWGSDR